MLYCYWIGKIGVGEKEREMQERQNFMGESVVKP